MSGENHNRQLILCGVCGECEHHDKVGSMCHSAYHRPPLDVCWTRHTGSNLDTVCCPVVDCVRVLKIAEAIVRVQK